MGCTGYIAYISLINYTKEAQLDELYCTSSFYIILYEAMNACYIEYTRKRYS